MRGGAWNRSSTRQLQIRFECYNSPHEPEKLENITKLIELSVERCLRQEEERRIKEIEESNE